MTDQKKITVRDLMAALLKLPADLRDSEVDLEGCDCTGRWSGAVEVRGGSVLLTREVEEDSPETKAALERLAAERAARAEKAERVNRPLGIPPRMSPLASSFDPASRR